MATEKAPAPLLRLLQLADSGFPTGAFAFSQGLEGLLDAGFVRGEAAVAALLRAQVEEAFAGIEAPAACLAHRFAATGDVDRLLDLDAHLSALKPVPALRDGSAKVGRRFLESAAGLVAGETVAAFREEVTAGRVAGHHAVSFGVVVQAVGLDEAETALALGAGFVGGLAAAAVRLGIVGQGAAQRIVTGLHVEVAASAARAREVPLEELGAYLPMVDVAGLRQPALAGRVFAS